MQQYTHRQTIMITANQANSLKVLKSYNVNVSAFIRLAIKDKLKRDWKSIKETKTRDYCPF